MSEQAVRTPRVLSKPRGKGKKSPMVLAIQVAFAALLLGAVGAGLWRATAQSEEETTVSGMPTKLLDLKLEQAITGPAAIADVTKLHGTDVQLTSAVVADYRANDETAELWVGDAGDPASAMKLVDRMTQKIGAGTGYFSQPQVIQVDGREVYSLTARDQLQHYYYQLGSKVVWLAFPPQRAEQALRSVLMLVH